MTSRIVTATLLVAFFNALPASGQDESRPPPSRTTYGMLLDGGERREPTVEEALYALTTERYGWPLLGQADVHAPVVAILRQIRGPRPEAEARWARTRRTSAVFNPRSKAVFLIARRSASRYLSVSSTYLKQKS